MGWGNDGIAYIFINDECKDSSGVARAVLAHEYFHVLQSWAGGTPLWMIEGYAEYFEHLWVDHAGLSTYGAIRNRTIGWVAANNPSQLRSDSSIGVVYRLGFLAIDYLVEQTGEAKLLDYFIAARRSQGRFESVFGISINTFYGYFAAHRAAGFPKPGASFDSPTPTPTPMPDPIVADGRIVFSSDRSGDYEIYAMNANGTGVTRLTNAAGRDWQPAWSPDGRRIAFSSNRSGDYEIYVMNEDGTGVSRLTNISGQDDTPAWSPDGRRIAFTSRAGGNQDIYVMNANGSNVTRLTDDPQEDGDPSWSPDGSRIMFESHRHDTWDIYVMNADGSNVTRLTTHRQTNGSPAWSPNGRRVAFKSWRNRDDEVYVMNADGSGQTRLTRSGGDDSWPTWSPNGQHIAFHSERDGNPNIYVMNADGSNKTRLTSHSANDWFPDWTSGSVGPGPVIPPTGGQIDDRVAQLERQVSTLQGEASAQQTRIGALNRLLAALQSLINRLVARVTALESATPQPPPFVPTPSPTPTPTPAVIASSACVTPMELGSAVHGSWTDDCLSENAPSNGTFYAKFYTFTLARQEELEIQIDSDSRPYINVLAGAGTDGRVLFQIRDLTGEGSSGEQTQLILQPGSYTLEITTHDPNVTGDFDLWLGLRR